MSKWSAYYLQDKHCRWCQKPYKAHIPRDRDGFCSDRCKMALTRAYKNYLAKKFPRALPKNSRPDLGQVAEL